jgi:hypothetical protein
MRAALRRVRLPAPRPASGPGGAPGSRPHTDRHAPAWRRWWPEAGVGSKGGGLLPRTAGARWMCSAPRQEEGAGEGVEKLPTMEALLRKLYMRVHPDLFAAHAEARAENEKSFQLLSEFLSAVKNQDAGGCAPQHFTHTLHTHLCAHHHTFSHPRTPHHAPMRLCLRHADALLTPC